MNDIREKMDDEQKNLERETAAASEEVSGQPTVAGSEKKQGQGATPAVRVDRAVHRASDTVRHAARDANEAVKRAAHEAGDATKEAVRDAGEAIDLAAHELADAAKRAAHVAAETVSKATRAKEETVKKPD